jgi:Phage head-tail joining protein
MNAGEFDREIELFAPTAPVDDGYTVIPGGFGSQGTRKAKYVPAMRREIFEAAGREAQLPVIFEVRSDTLTRQIDETWQIGFEGDIYDVKGKQQVGRRKYIRIEALAADE